MEVARQTLASGLHKFAASRVTVIFVIDPGQHP
jgi:hypothetical protein